MPAQPPVALRECLWITPTVMAFTKPGGHCFEKSQWQNLGPAKERMEQVWENNKFLQTIYLLLSPDAINSR